uniref:Uncharacterized protein n=1 Tax=Cyprinus carpio TaxID=7962 RepID=A0A8C2CSM1_CYPCA
TYLVQVQELIPVVLLNVLSFLVSSFFFLICFLGHTVLVCPHSGTWTCACLRPPKLDSVFFLCLCSLVISLLLRFLLHFLLLLCFGLKDLPAVSRGPSPLPEASVTGDLLSDSFVAPAVAPAAPVSPPKAEPGPVLDLLDTFGDTTGETQSSAPGAPSVDLLGGLISPVAPTVTPTPAPVPSSAPANLLESAFDAFGSELVSTTPAAADSAPATAAPSGGFDASEDLLMPAITPQSTGGTPMAAGSTPLTPGIVPTTGPTMTPAMAPAMTPTIAPTAAAQPTKPIGGDLDVSLANLVGNLGVGSQKKDNQWNEKKLTGGANWTPQVAPTSWGTPGAQMSGSASGAPGAAAPPGAMAPPMGAQPGFGMAPAVGAPMMPQPLMMGQSMMRPPFTGPAATGTPGAPLSPGPAAQSPKKPPTKDPLADLNIKDFF